MNRAGASSWRVWLLSLAAGALAAVASVFWGALPAWPQHIVGLLLQVYDKVGIAVLGLVPLGAWGSVLVTRQISRGGYADDVTELDYGFISRNATLLGLLGTIIALAAAGGKLSIDVGQGGSGSILKIIPLVGQALISTIVGIVIALMADCALHFIERARIKAEE